jgi:alkaline phosphatase
MPRRLPVFVLILLLYPLAAIAQEEHIDAPRVQVDAADPADPARELQSRGINEQKASWGHWGNQPDHYSKWTNHSNRLVPVYTFGITLDSLRDAGSVYADPQRLHKLYGRVPAGTVNPTALYYDQTDIYRLQQTALEAGFSNIILMVFDGMDWQTTRAAALYNAASKGKRVPIYNTGRGTGLLFQDDRRVQTDFGLICTSPFFGEVKFDVNSQTILDTDRQSTGGYDVVRGGEAPWHERSAGDYLLGKDREQPHAVTDSASSATSLTSGIKTTNGAINFAPDGRQVIPIARELQADQDFKVGIVTSVQISHATPAAAYANNVSRDDYQDIARDLIGLPSSSHRTDPLPGVDVLIGAGWGEEKAEDTAQGDNYMSGNPYIHREDIKRIDQQQGGKYIVVQRTEGKPGTKRLMAAAQQAADENSRLFGLFGTTGGHLPFRTADGKYNPTVDVKGTEQYTPADLAENPTLADMTRAALLVLEQAIDGFWLLIEAGEVDWANHANNIDNSIGAVISGEDAFRVVMDWVDENNAWSYTAVIVTADHGHYLVIEDAQRIVEAGQSAASRARQLKKP